MVEEYRTIGKLDSDDILKEVEKAIEKLETSGRDISFTSISEITGRAYQTLNKEDKIRELILEHRSGYLPNEDVEIQDVKEVIEKIKGNGSKLTKTNIMDQLEISWHKLHDQPDIVEYMEDQIADKKKKMRMTSRRK